MAPENELLSSWREELRQQASQGSGRGEELEGGGEEQERTDVIRSIVDIYGPILDDSR